MEVSPDSGPGLRVRRREAARQLRAHLLVVPDARSVTRARAVVVFHPVVHHFRRHLDVDHCRELSELQDTGDQHKMLEA